MGEGKGRIRIAANTFFLMAFIKWVQEREEGEKRLQGQLADKFR